VLGTWTGASIVEVPAACSNACPVENAFLEPAIEMALDLLGFSDIEALGEYLVEHRETVDFEQFGAGVASLISVLQDVLEGESQ